MMDTIDELLNDDYDNELSRAKRNKNNHMMRGGGQLVEDDDEEEEESTSTENDDSFDDDDDLPVPVRSKALEDAGEQLEKILDKDMSRLSMIERDSLLFDIHGFSDNMAGIVPSTTTTTFNNNCGYNYNENTNYDDEDNRSHNEQELDENTINKLLEQVEEELRRAPHTKAKDAYVQARYLNEAYVTDRSFRLMFLRADKYNPKVAAERLMAHFTLKLELFGGEGATASSSASKEILGREIHWDDLSEDDKVTVKSGYVQVLKSRDTAGRTVTFSSPSHKIYKTYYGLMRAVWYVLMCALRDEECQLKGNVGICYNTDYFLKPEAVIIMGLLGRFRPGVPIRVIANHYCYTDFRIRPLVAGTRLFMGQALRNRLRPHYGSHSELMFKMQTFGINANDLPINSDGTLSLKWHHEWLEMQQAYEESSRCCLIQQSGGVITSSSLSLSRDVIVPRRFDVLFGRGRDTRVHPGNLRAAHLVDMYQAKYEEANKADKTKIAEDIIKIIHESYGRFLKRERKTNMWVEVTDEVARGKISHYFRSNRSKKSSSTPDSPIDIAEEDDDSDKEGSNIFTSSSSSAASLSSVPSLKREKYASS